MYAELQVTSNYSFLRGGSHAAELVERAKALNLAAIGIADRNSLAGVVRMHAAAKQAGIRLVVGARLDFRDAPSLLCFPQDRAAYGRLSSLLTLGKRRAPKGACYLDLADLEAHAEGQQLVAICDDRPDAAFAAHLRGLKRLAGNRLSLAASHLYRGDDKARLKALGDLADAVGVPLLATNDVLYYAPSRRPLQDILTCIRQGCTIDTAGARLLANGERHLKDPAEMARLFRDRPEALRRSLEIMAACRFSLDDLRYEYPAEPVPPGETAQSALEHLTREGADGRFPGGVPEKVQATLRHELALIAQLSYAPYFLTVADIVSFARSRGILCQGRGSAANSAVCYCLGITAVDPDTHELLFERFVSAERNEPPDIDVDFEHERREEVIQYIYAKYGRERAGLAATVISYRPKSALRDVGKAMGLSQDAVGVLARTVWGWGAEGIKADCIREAGLNPADRRLRLALLLARELIGFPRHLSQHVGGFVITKGPLHELVPIENAAMQDRTLIEWDKDDLDALGLLKIDVLALGMLTCLRKGFDLLRQHKGIDLDLATIPSEDPAVYDMLCRADSVGVFQVESRAQMSMLPRLKPRCFYDLVIEVAIVRPGPIQGDMVHPYLRRRNGEEPVGYPSPELERVLKRTLGVPLFQEQAMQIAIVAAGFTPSEADRLRRAMATFRKVGTIQYFEEKMIEGMVARGYDRGFAERCFGQIRGFGEYGFPESHAASFALLVYASSWLKCHHPAIFAAAILNSQPMGFYAPAQLVRDAAEHGVEVLPVDANHSHWDCALEPGTGGLALRLGFRLVKGAREEEIERLVAARATPYGSIAELQRRTCLSPASLERLARADAFAGMGHDRRAALWQVRGLDLSPLPLFTAADNARPEPAVALPAMALGEQVVEDYAVTGLSVKRHPLALLRDRLTADRMRACAELATLPSGAKVRVAGLVLVRQRPGTASGVIFATLEDETGIANIIIWPKVFEANRKALLGSRLLGVEGILQREESVTHVIAARLIELNHHLAALGEADEAGGAGEAFTGAIARADEVRRPGGDQRQKQVTAAEAVMPKGRNFR
ncbi:MAG: error-prone DNA polymerase [Alphaproteobacteria bacterium]|nr:error-prone DNA polymerase [Alphaproteobacteria bacterium]MBU0799231.1 error-prone DNA polymerase [Alphaproteobacteria bacterium]MBU0887518.1 error-prone DNA polymerase [Alphaproteobacteria bacterium]MBU1814755.1 error-prone DNA polymerase [Alphaproteobacteria bacterium]